MKTSILILPIIAAFGLNSQAIPVQPKLISATEVSAMASDSVAQELSDLNEALSNSDSNSIHYNKKMLRKFKEQTHKSAVSVDELTQKCTYSESDLANLDSPILNPENDVTTEKMKSLESVGTLYGKDVWRLFSQVCRFAQVRFEKRLGQIQSGGSALNLNAAEIKTISSILFFPTQMGSAPSFKKEIALEIFNTAIMGSLVFGPIAALSAMAIGTQFIMVATASSSSNGILSEMTTHFQKSPNTKLGELLSRSPIEMSLDLTQDEIKWLTKPLNANGAFEIGSTDLAPGGEIPLANIYNGMGCTGKNISPEIHWNNPPVGTKSFALTVYDPKAPTGSGFWHWIVTDIPPNVSSIPRGTSGKDAGKVIPNDFGSASYDGPCPPQGWTDPYTFTIYALSTDRLESLGLQDGSTNAVARFFLQAGGTILGSASFTVNYNRQ